MAHRLYLGVVYKARVFSSHDVIKNPLFYITKILMLSFSEDVQQRHASSWKSEILRANSFLIYDKNWLIIFLYFYKLVKLLFTVIF